MTQQSHLKTYEHAGHVVFIHTYKSVTRGWALQVTVTGEDAHGHTWTKHLADRGDIICDDPEQALATGEEIACALIDGIAAAA